jgi:hypothetical protein
VLIIADHSLSNQEVLWSEKRGTWCNVRKKSIHRAGLDADEMEGTLATLLQLGAAVQAQCTAATAHLLHLLSSPPGILNPPGTGSAVLVFSEGLVPSSFACLLDRFQWALTVAFTLKLLCCNCPQQALAHLFKESCPGILLYPNTIPSNMSA